jgi:hypothetical protein
VALGSVRTVVPDKQLIAANCRSPDGRWLVVGLDAMYPAGDMGRLRIIDLAAGVHDEWAGPPGWAKRLSQPTFAPDGRWLAFEEHGWDEDGGVRLWDLAGRRPGPFLPDARGVPKFSADGRRAIGAVQAAAGPDEPNTELAVWEVASGRELARHAYPPGYYITAVSPNGNLLIEVSEGRVAGEFFVKRGVCWNVADGRELWSVDGLVSRLRTWVLVDGGRRLVAEQVDETTGAREVVGLNVENGRADWRLPLHHAILHDVGPDGRSVLLFSDAPTGLNAVRRWLAQYGLPGLAPTPDTTGVLVDTVTGATIMAFHPPQHVWWSWAPDGRSFAAVDPDGNLAIWDIPPRKPLGWFALAAAVLALPLAWLTRRRIRRLRSLAGITP